MRRLGKYLLVDRIAQGGMADVYLAKRFGFEGTDQHFALKCIKSDFSKDPEHVSMFVEEAKLSVLLKHDNIAHVHELGFVDEVHFIAMEHIMGRDLRVMLNRLSHLGRRLPERLVLHIIAQTLEGLDYAHRKTDPAGRLLGIVHQDISPQNVLISFKGDVKIIDFGIAKATETHGGAAEDQLRGKYGYMSPEQALGRPVDSRSDVFAVGVVMYELLTQKRLFEGTSELSTIEKVRNAEVYPPSVVAKSVSPQIERIVLNALAAEPEHRYSSASAMHDDIIKLLLEEQERPTTRELAAFMQELLPDEMNSEHELFERARQLEDPGEEEEVDDTDPSARVYPPGDAGAAGANPHAAVPDDGSADEFPEEADITAITSGSLDETIRDESMAGAELDVTSQADIDADTYPGTLLLPPTGTGVGIRMRQRRRDSLILGAATLFATSLVVATWIFTSGGSSPTTGRLTIHSAPPNALVLLDGAEVGTTPFKSADIDAGTHVVTLMHVGYLAVSRAVSVNAGEENSIEVTLSRSTSVAQPP